jgi:sporulation protein YlmC with PRC-barrel domain
VRATDLLHKEAVDVDGERVGTVDDVRLDAYWTNDHHLVCRLSGLSCRAAESFGHQLGFGQGEMAGPWPLSALFRWRHRVASVEVDWSDVAAIEPDRVVLRHPAATIHFRSRQIADRRGAGNAQAVRDLTGDPQHDQNAGSGS